MANATSSHPLTSATAPLAFRDRILADRLCLFALIAMVFFLPLFEAPKNLFAGAYLLLWLGASIQRKDFGGPWRAWDTLFLIWIASGFVVAWGAGEHKSEWRGALDLLRYGLIGWTVSRMRLSERDYLALAIALAFGTTLGLLYGYWQFAFNPKRVYLEIHSVGHVNHSAIFLAIVTGGLVSLILAYARGLKLMHWITLGLVLAFFVVSLFVMSSRAALGVFVLILFVQGVAWALRSRRAALTVLSAMALMVTVAIVARVDVIKKQEENAAKQNVLSYRDQIWAAAWIAFRANPVFGIGMDNYSVISVDKLKTWTAKLGVPYREQDYFMTSHAHNLYMNALAERGIAGTSVLLLVMICWTVSVLRFLPGMSTAPPFAATLWGFALSALLCAVFIGTVNTTLHHEHGILSVGLLGAWIGWRARGGAVA